MKPLLFTTALATLAVGAAACSSKAPAPRAALDCPTSEGGLTRASAAADGKSCLYTTAEGDEISLRLLPVSTTPQAALQPIETELKSVAGARGPAAPVPPAPPQPPTAASAETAKDAAQAAKEARADAAQAEADAKAAEDEGRPAHNEHTHVDLPGIHIDADDGGDSAHVKVGMINVDAGEDGATVRMSRDVRLRGQPFSREKGGFRATYIIANDDMGGGYKAVGYEAGGPRGGPITVAVVKSRSGRHNGVFEDVQKLVRRNGGV